MVNDFLFELGCEELPSAAVLALSNALATAVADALQKAQINHTGIQQFATPRRLALLISGLQQQQPSQRQTRRGPALSAAYTPEGKPTPAVIGFARSCGVEVSDLTEFKTDKGDWLVYESETTGAQTSSLMPGLISEALKGLPIAKPMRWGSGDAEFVRPVHWAVMLFGKEIINSDVFGIKTGRSTHGHRFHAPQAIDIDEPRHYEALLQDAYVIADFAKRKKLIEQQISAEASKQNAKAIMPEALVDEVTSIVEWPTALTAHFSADFLDVPQEALIASMQSHQKCFALQNTSGKLLPGFITVSNIQSKNPQQVIMGNEKVMRARLSDAAFFFRQDKKLPLSTHIAATANVVFQVRLGTLLDKTSRIETLMNYLVNPLKLNKEQAVRAAQLSKCDLMTGMVGEFPELQGLMGYYYALHDGEASGVAQALNEQYLPRFSGDELPESDLGMALSLADRLDTLVGIFAIGQKPSGVKDPFKLRRHALAVVRLLIASPEPLNLTALIQESIRAYGSQFNEANILNELHTFIMERLQSYYQAHDISSDLVHAVRARQQDWLYDFSNRLNALAEFIKLPEAVSLSAACKRVNNLLQQNEVSSKSVNEQLLTEPAEKELFKKINAMEEKVASLYATGDYTLLLTKLASLREPVDAFFESVMVMVENTSVKENRLALLSKLQTLLQGVADISLLQFNQTQ